MITLSSTFSPAISSRVSFLSSSSSSSSSPSSRLFAVSVSLTGPPRRRRRSGLACPCFSAMADLVKDKEEASPSSSAAAGKMPEPERRSRALLDAMSEEELLSGIRERKEAGRIPPNVASGMEELYHNYKNAIIQSGNPRAEEIVLTNMAATLDRIFFEVEDPFVFSPHHKALREPFDYYTFGQQYIRPLIDIRNSYVGNISIFSDMEEKLKEGHNIALISNHQTEADPAVIALSLESRHPYLAENMTYIAGDRVLTDPLCKPFSMGRNLICVYSKKHMLDVPELVEMKRRANTRSLKELALLLRGGSRIIWIAPSGGRDRPDPVTGEWYPAPFDSSPVDNMRRLLEHSGVPGHIYPLALLCYDIMPPPQKVEKEIGEKRIISFHGAGLSVAPAISFSSIAESAELPEEIAKEAYTEALFSSVNEQYNVLKSAVHGKQGFKASSPTVSLSQPWT